MTRALLWDVGPWVRFKWKGSDRQKGGKHKTFQPSAQGVAAAGVGAGGRQLAFYHNAWYDVQYTECQPFTIMRTMTCES